MSETVLQRTKHYSLVMNSTVARVKKLVPCEYYTYNESDSVGYSIPVMLPDISVQRNSNNELVFLPGVPESKDADARTRALQEVTLECQFLASVAKLFNL